MDILYMRDYIYSSIIDMTDIPNAIVDIPNSTMDINVHQSLYP